MVRIIYFIAVAGLVASIAAFVRDPGFGPSLAFLLSSAVLVSPPIIEEARIETVRTDDEATEADPDVIVAEERAEERTDETTL